jgi:hypothetical protein
MTSYIEKWWSEEEQWSYYNNQFFNNRNNTGKKTFFAWRSRMLGRMRNWCEGRSPGIWKRPPRDHFFAPRPRTYLDWESRREGEGTEYRARLESMLDKITLITPRTRRLILSFSKIALTPATLLTELKYRFPIVHFCRGKAAQEEEDERREEREREEEQASPKRTNSKVL